jgi:ribonuclease P protein subunit POP4
MKWLIRRNDLIGLEIEVKKSFQRNQQGLRGVVVDETLNTLSVRTPAGKELKLQKKLLTSLVIVRSDEEGGPFEVNGEDLVTRPEDRMKKYWRKVRR